MAYVDGYVAAVPEKNREVYVRLAAEAWEVFRDHGATGITECWGDDVPDGEVTSFPKAVKKQEGEVVVFSWILWPSREARDRGMEAAMKDPRFVNMDRSQAPFDGKRMIFGGFQPVFEAQA